MDPRAGAAGARLRAAQGPDARARSPHGVRGGPLPEPRRVLEPRHGHVHDPRRRVHARLRLLRREDGAARGAARPGRGAPRRRGRGAHGPASRRRHLGQQRRPPGRRRGRVRRDDRRDPRARPGLRGRGADPGLQGPLGRARRGAPGPPRHPQPQRRDGAAPLPDRACGGQLRSIARAPGPFEGRGSRDQERHHARPRRGAGRGRGDDPGDPRLVDRHPHGRPVPAALAAAPAGAALLHAAGVRRAADLRARAGLRARRIGSARALQLSRRRARARGGPRP